MKIIRYACIPLLVLLLAACDQSKKDSGNAHSLQGYASQEDSLLVIGERTPFQYRPCSIKKELQYSIYDVTMDYPYDGEQALVDSVRWWLNSRLGNSFDVDLSKPKEMLSYYAKSFDDEITDEDRSFLREMEMKMELSCYCKIIMDTDSLLTYKVETYYYGGGVHGVSDIYGVTFRKRDGHQFGWDMLKPGLSLYKEIKQGLMTYFEVDNDIDLFQSMLLDEDTSVDAIPYPTTEPWIERDGLHFTYSAYEVACYAAGLPSFVIPGERAKKYLKPEVLSLLR